jgi:hypothetical protein
VVEIRLGGVDGDERDAADVLHRVALAEQLLEVDVAHVSRIVVARDDDERVALDPIEILTRALVLLAEAESRQVARAHDHVRLELVDLVDRALEEIRHEVAFPAVEIRDVREREAAVHSREA